MTEAELLDLARAQKNPFLGSVLRNGFEEPPNDVPEIHGGVRVRLRGLIEDVRNNGQLAFQIITGEPGDGKTHLLATLRAESERSWLKPETAHAMVPIEPVRNPEAPFAHILRAIFNGLSRPFARESDSTPLEYLLLRILMRVTKLLAAKGNVTCARAAAQLDGPLYRFPALTAEILRTHWSDLEPELTREALHLDGLTPDRVDAEVWNVLCRFPRERTLVVRWLSGYSLPEQELAKLGVAEPIESEDRAYLAIRTFLHLSDAPIVLGFDQLEGVARLGEDAVARFLQALGDQLFGGGGRALVLLFCQADVWDAFSKQIRTQTRDRLLQASPIHLAPMSPDLGEKLVACRLAAMWAGAEAAPPHSTFPFARGEVRRTIEAKPLKGPRRVLTHFAENWLVPAKPEAPKDARVVAREEFEKLKQASHDIPPNDRATYAESALATILERAQGTALAGAHIVRASRKKGLQLKVARNGKELSAYAEASNSENGMAAKSVAKRMREALTRTDRSILLRDEKVPVPPLARKMIGELGDKAAIVKVRDDESASFAAVEKLLNNAASGDTDVSPELAKQFIVEEIAPALDVVRRFLDAAVGDAPIATAATGSNHESLVLSAIARPPFVVSEAQIARAHGLTVDDVARASDALEQQGKAKVERAKDGGRTVWRRPT